MDHDISHGKHFRPGKLGVACPDLCRYMPRSFSDDLEIAQNRVNGFFIPLKVIKAIPFGETPNFGNALQDIRNSHFSVSRRHGSPLAEFPLAFPGEGLLVLPNLRVAPEFLPGIF